MKYKCEILLKRRAKINSGYFQLVELKRNPGGSIDKRIRATLRPMSKTGRDSNVTELEHKLKEVKSFNSKFRKQLLEKESELQVSFNNTITVHLINRFLLKINSY